MLPSESIPASIVIPTRGRPAYLEVALSSIVPQAQAAGAEVLVIDDAGPSPGARAQAERFGVRYEPHERPLSLNVARNTGVERSVGELVVFVDDDIEAGPGWLTALLTAADEHPDVDVFAGQIRPRLEGRGGAAHSCGREDAPITTLQLGCGDTETRYAWGANMAIRREALERVGAFDVHSSTAGMSRSGRIACAPPSPRHGCCTWQAQRSITAAPGQTRGCADSRGPSTHVAGPRADSMRAADRLHRCGAS